MSSQRYALVCRGLGIAATMLLVLAPLLYRSHLAPLRLSLLLVPTAALCGLVAVIAAAWALRKGLPTAGSRPLLTGLLLGALPVTFFGIVAVSGRGIPPIHDITTDPPDPPVFVTAPTLARDALNSLDYDRANLVAQQQAYPDLRPIVTAEPLAAAFEHARRAAAQLGWDIYAADAANGRIEAVDTTLLFGFKDDVVIRLRPRDSGTVIDLRSVSRVGRGDLGANAKRIRRFVDTYQTSAGET